VRGASGAVKVGDPRWATPPGAPDGVVGSQWRIKSVADSILTDRDFLV